MVQNRQAQTKEPVYYLEAANGMTVRVPESRLAAWQAEQDRQRREGSKPLSSSEQHLIDGIVSDLYRGRK